MNNASPKIIISGRVKAARENNLPVVALESTVLTHGLPYPQNLEVFHTLEGILAENGVVAATTIVLDGIAYIGMEEEQLEMLDRLLRIPGSFRKLGMRDLPLALAQEASGGTTVSATMRLAHHAGISVFATGGIGGVHRGWQQHWDVSSDLTALAQIPIAVVSAGCKAILDVPATLEYLETLGVPVLGWQCDRFPLFYTRESEYPIARLGVEYEFAEYWTQHLALQGKGVLIANPIPSQYSIPAEQMEPPIALAVETAREKGISGAALTPFLLDFLAQHTKGDSVEANLALLKNNVRVAARLAKALCGEEG